MRLFKGDLHIHTLLSPCADLEMTPRNIAGMAVKSGLDLIGITDHNSTKNCLAVKRAALQQGIFVLTGVEVTTKEEVHCLTFFEKEDQLNEFQSYIDQKIQKIPNDEDRFGFQPVVDENDNILEMIPWFLPAALNASIGEIQKKVSMLNGIFIPAHVDRPANGIFSQLGFIPADLKYDALGLSPHANLNHVVKHNVLHDKTTFIRNSDAHYLKQIGEIYTVFKMERIDFAEIRLAISKLSGRSVEVS